MYKISPSTLKAGLDPKFGCRRCFWLKCRHDVRFPSMGGLGKIHSDIHGFIYDWLKTGWLDIIPKGKIIETELHVESGEINGIALHGFIDILIELDFGGYLVIDIKTTSNLAWITKNYSLQLNTYRYCLENPPSELPVYAPISQLGILSFSPNRFAIRDNDNAGIAGTLQWHEIRADNGLIGESIGEAAAILAGKIPDYTEGCETCQFYQQWGDPYDVVRSNRILFT